MVYIEGAMERRMENGSGLCHLEYCLRAWRPISNKDADN